jgi:hypothetical protein
MAGNGSRGGAIRAGSRSGVKVSAEQRAIATEMKKAIQRKNVQATRILQRIAAKDGHGGDVRSLTASGSRHLNRWETAPMNRQRGNAMSAERNRDLSFNRRPSRRLVTAALQAVEAGRSTFGRVDRVLKASGVDYMGLNSGYERALATARSRQAARRRAQR